jgi:hypothetical protein
MSMLQLEFLIWFSFIIIVVSLFITVIFKGELQNNHNTTCVIYAEKGTPFSIDKCDMVIRGEQK